MQAASVEVCNCPCIHQTQIGGGRVNFSTDQNTLSFNQYLTPLLAGLASPYGVSNSLSATSASGILPQLSYSPYSLSSLGSSAMNYNTLSLLSLLLGSGLGSTGSSTSMLQQSYGNGSSYRSVTAPSRLQSPSVLDVKL